ncbi:hypothetical protein ASD8599_00946 [Ascidiaceihabitans donghaensis]|uniref:Argininosuccinate lyase n=1 Tax=Ascidiaceihabitans donghaensis TaxID=1510460 RepID=A0A2R8BAZ2_9RHOB|nr:hypothetical protein [Ascidiaceihabitans donghaensis]SPH20207.1 hypothetical protein ASD8599_00946 [Ascidiaceihabitans donghaensis]
MKLTFGLIFAVVLAACGADGEPVQPNLSAGVSVGSGGVNGNVGVSVRKGPVSIGWNIF